MAADGKAPRGPSDETWAEARKAFAAGESLRKIAKRLAIRYGTLLARQKRDAWTVTLTTADPNASNVVDFAARRAVDDAGNRDWSAIRARYVQGAESLADVAIALEIPEDTVTRAAANRRKNDGKTWSELRSEYRARREELVEQKALESSASAVAEELLVTRRITLVMAKAFEAFANDLEKGLVQPSEFPGTRDQAQIMKDAATSFKLIMSTIREDAGRVAGESTVQPADESTEGNDSAGYILEHRVVEEPHKAAS